MSNNPDGQTPPPPELKQSKELPEIVKILHDVEAKLVATQSAPVVRSRVIDQMVEAELSKRVQTLSAAMGMRDRLVGDLRKAENCKQVLIDAETNKRTAYFDPKAMQALEQARKRLKEFDDAVTTAVVQADFTKLTQLINAKPNNKSDQSPDVNADNKTEG